MGQADAHLVRQLVLGEQLTQLHRELVGVDHLAVDHEAYRQRVDDGAPHAGALGPRRLQDDDGVGADVESNRR